MKPKTPQPVPSTITYDRVRDLLVRMSKTSTKSWYAVHEIIDLMNGWNGTWAPPNKTLTAARKKLQQAPGSTHHEHPTSGQASATRKQLEQLVAEGVAEKQQGGGRSNNSFSYRWITQKMLDTRALQKTRSTEANDLARRLSLALGGDGESGVKPFLTPDDEIGIRVNLYGKTAERVLEAIKQSGLGPDFFTGKHWEILTSRGEVMGCCADRDDVRREEPDATFREVKIEKCSSCDGGDT